MTVVNTYANQAEAYIDKGYLVSHGIPAEVESDALSELFPGPVMAGGFIRLVVPGKYAEEAMRLLEHRD